MDCFLELELEEPGLRSRLRASFRGTWGASCTVRSQPPDVQKMGLPLSRYPYGQRIPWKRILKQPLKLEAAQVNLPSHA